MEWFGIGPLTLLMPKSSYGVQPLQMQPSDPAGQVCPSVLMNFPKLSLLLVAEPQRGHLENISGLSLCTH